MDEILKIVDLTFKYGDKLIFDKLSLLLEYDNWYTLINDSASGATTLVKIISGLLKDYDGDIEFNFLNLNEKNLYEIRTRMSILFDDADNQILTDNVYDEITFELHNMNFGEDLIERYIDDIDKYTGIKSIISKSTAELDHEERCLVLLTSALIIKPKLLIIDETFSSMSKSERANFFNIIKNYNEENKITILNISNNLEDSLVGDYIIYLKDGKISFNERVQKVYDEKLLTEETESLPFIIKISEYLKLYDLTDKNYYSLEEMVEALWK